MHCNMMQYAKAHQVVSLLQQRRQPTSQAHLLEYFLSTEMEEMQYEVARCRPMVDAAFMQYLDTQIGKTCYDKSWSAFM